MRFNHFIRIASTVFLVIVAMDSIRGWSRAAF